MANDHLTAVIISYRKNRLNNRLIFGAPILQVRRGWRRSIVAFAPGQLFAYERWRGDQYGTQDWRIFVCAAGATGSVSPIPGVTPGADILLFAKGKIRVKRALSAIGLMKSKFGSLPKIMPDHWRHLSNDIETGAFDPGNYVRNECEK